MSFAGSNLVSTANTGAAGSIDNVHATMKTCLLEAEELLHALTDVKADQGNIYFLCTSQPYVCNSLHTQDISGVGRVA